MARPLSAWHPGASDIGALGPSPRGALRLSSLAPWS